MLVSAIGEQANSMNTDGGGDMEGQPQGEELGEPWEGLLSGQVGGSLCQEVTVELPTC